MRALVSLIVILSLSVLIVRVGTVALTMTGVSEEIATLQAMSAFSGAGFTTEESERVVSYPSRRAVVKSLIMLGNVGLITSVATLVLTFADPTSRLSRLLILIAFALTVIALSRSEWFDRLLNPAIERALRRTATLELRDYTDLLELDRDYTVADLPVSEDSWLATGTLADLDLRSGEGVVVLGIRREDGTYIGAPGGHDRILPGDTVIAYGQRERLRELVDRGSDDVEAHEDAKTAHERTLAVQRSIDPERKPDGGRTLDGERA